MAYIEDPDEEIKAYKFTAAVKEQFLDLLRNGNSRKTACEQCDISRWTLINHMKAYPDFKQAVEEAEAESIDIVEEALFQKACRGNTTAAIFILKCRRGEKWNEKPDHSGYYSQEELEQRIEQLIELAVRRLPEAERAGFINDLRTLAGLDEGAGQYLEAPASGPD